MWCIPSKEDAAFVCQMEQVLEVYKRPYDPQRPVVCMDEQPKQLIAETRRPLPGKPERVDHEHVREGVCTVWMFVESLGGWRNVPVTSTKKTIDWAEQVQRLVDNPRYQAAEKITRVCDTLNTHKLASLYAAFEPAEAMRLTKKLELIHTPKHGSWLCQSRMRVQLEVFCTLLQRCVGKLHQETFATARWLGHRVFHSRCRSKPTQTATKNCFCADFWAHNLRQKSSLPLPTTTNASSRCVKIPRQPNERPGC